MKPSPLALSTFGFFGVLFDQNVSDLKKFFGFEPSKPAQPRGPADSPLRRKTTRLQQEATKDPEAVEDPGTMTANQRASDGAAAAASGVPTNTGASTTPAGKSPVAQTTNTSTTTPATGTRDPNKMPSAKDLIPYGTMRPHINGAWNEWKKTFSQTWAPLIPYPPGGCIRVSGFVELDAEHAVCVIDVDAFWNPKTGQYDMSSMRMKLRSFTPKVQAPAAR